MRFCRVHLILLVVFVAWSSPSRARKGRGKEAHDRHASPSVRTCFFLLLFFLNRTSESPWSDFGTRERERKSETNERRRTWCKMGGKKGDGKEERKTRQERGTDVQQRRAMQNLTVQGTGASDDGSREFVLVPPSRNFVPYSFFFLFFFLFAAPFPFACARPPLVA